jgi:DNA-binding FadR family transcriptional regulator
MSSGRRSPPRSGMISSRKHNLLTHDLGRAIVAGEYKSGDIIMGEVESSARFNVSRGAYREALRSLAAKGLLESRPRVGTRVSDRKFWNFLDQDVLAWAFEGVPDENLIRELFELRLIVEPEAARIAARRRTGADLARMAHALEEMAIHGIASRSGQSADLAFHSCLLRATQNGSLVTLGKSINAIISWTTFFKQTHQKLGRDPIPDHRFLFEAIADLDEGRAKSSMIKLIELALADVNTGIVIPPQRSWLSRIPDIGC